MENVCLISIGSDGTDGPADAAGGYADTDTAGELRVAFCGTPWVPGKPPGFGTVSKNLHILLYKIAQTGW